MDHASALYLHGPEGEATTNTVVVYLCENFELLSFYMTIHSFLKILKDFYTKSISKKSLIANHFNFLVNIEKDLYYWMDPIVLTIGFFEVFSKIYLYTCIFLLLIV